MACRTDVAEAVQNRYRGETVNPPPREIVVDTLAVAVGIILAAFAGVLSALASAAWSRFGEGRFLLVGMAYLIISIVAVLAVIAETGYLAVAWFDETFTLEPVPSALLLVAVLLIYAAMVRRHPAAAGFHDARP